MKQKEQETVAGDLDTPVDDPNEKPVSYQKLTSQASDVRLAMMKAHDIERIGVKQANRWDERSKIWNTAMSLLREALEEIRKLESQ